MANRSWKKIAAIIVACVGASGARGMNILQPYDTLIMPLHDTQHTWHLLGHAETGINDKGFDWDGGGTDVLRIWHCDQQALDMLKGAPDGSPIASKNLEIEAIPGLDSDPRAGLFCVSGDLRLDFAGALWGRYTWCNNLVFSLFFPFYAFRLGDVRWCDQTTNEELIEKLTGDLPRYTRELGCLDICGWRRVGPGDLAFFASWIRDFPQRREWLQNVRLDCRLGLTIPTGLRQDENKIFAFPFGFDGACGIPFGLGLTVMMRPCFIAGMDVQLTPTFGNTRPRRIKTHECQTDLLFLNKTRAYKDFGLLQRFNLFVGLHRPWAGLSGRVGYQYLKRGENFLSLTCSNFSQRIANTAVSLDEWTLHQIVVYAENDFSWCVDDAACVQPRLALYARIPFNGVRSAATTNIGLTFSLDF